MSGCDGSALVVGLVSARVADFFHRLRASWLTAFGFGPLGVTSGGGHRRRAVAARVALGPVPVAEEVLLAGCAGAVELVDRDLTGNEDLHHLEAFGEVPSAPER